MQLFYRWSLAGLNGLIFEGFCGERISKGLLFGVWRHFSPELSGLNWRVDQIPYSDEVVSGGRKSEHPSDLVHTTMSGLT